MKPPSFLSNPDLVVGIPVFLEKFCLAEVIPKSLLHEKLKPNFAIINYFINVNKSEVKLTKSFSEGFESFDILFACS